MDAAKLTDRQLVEQLKAIARDDRASMRRFIELLNEFHKRELGTRSHHGSTFMWCRNELFLSEGESFRRLQVARVIERFPPLLDMIEDGRLNMTVASVLAPVLDKSNFEELTRAAKGMSKRDAEFLVARHRAKPEPRDHVRVLMGMRQSPPPPPPPPSVSTEEPPSRETTEFPPEAPATPPGPLPDRVEPLTARSARIAFTGDLELLALLERARGLMRHKHPEGHFADVFRAALDALLDAVDPSRKPKDAPARSVLPDRRRIPQFVKDEVWKRDNGRCAFVSVDGHRCGTTEWLEYDHVTPFALGGRSDDPGNVRLLCRAHNQQAARDLFGDGSWDAAAGA